MNHFFVHKHFTRHVLLSTQCTQHMYSDKPHLSQEIYAATHDHGWYRCPQDSKHQNRANVLEKVALKLRKSCFYVYMVIITMKTQD